jgi:phosphinothricin acetyltransferase
MGIKTRAAARRDAAAIARIYNEGIADRVATFETAPRTATDIEAWFTGDRLIVVAEEGQAVVAFASTSPYRGRPCYAGVAEFSLWVYVAREARGRGAGTLAMAALLEHAEDAGYWKLVSRVFPENMASRALLRTMGFRKVGIYEKHARLDGAWRDVVIVERPLPRNLT